MSLQCDSFPGLSATASTYIALDVEKGRREVCVCVLGGEATNHKNLKSVIVEKVDTW